MFVAIIFNEDECFEVSVWCLGLVQIAKSDFLSADISKRLNICQLAEGKSSLCGKKIVGDNQLELP